ncbi:MAG: hypothetical protein J4F33_13145 [Alphaproteobacteria bacterium]|nr:hypothetical protein [Alphaproteobacteria bacterium]
MRTALAALVAVAALPLAVAAEEGGEAHGGPYVGSPELELLKTLAGSWVMAGAQEETPAAEYRVAANGSVVVERSFPDTPKEMISVYHDRGGKLSMTHYCALANQPQMSLTTFELVKGSLESEEMPHMNGVSIAFDGRDEMSQTWSMFAGPGQETKTHTMRFRRAR